MPGHNRNYFRITRLILLDLPFLFRFFALFRKPAKHLLIIKTDAIGDYILFRNFLEIVCHSEKFENYRITLLGNEIWKDATLLYDKNFVDEFIFSRPNDFYYKPLKVLLLGWQLFKGNYETVLQPSYTRLLITDGLAALTSAKNIIGFDGDNEGILPRYKVKTDKFYTSKLALPVSISFEFDRLKFFFENVLQRHIQLTTPFIEIPQTETNGIVIFPGAGDFKRGWGKERFLALIKLLFRHTNQQIYLAGGLAELEAADYLTRNLPPATINNLTGKTTLPQLINLIGNAALVISNETSTIHIAAAMRTKSVCILGGGHFGRFAPYVGESLYNPVCAYEKMDCYNCNWHCKFHTSENEPYPCVSAVSVEKVWREVFPLLENQGSRVKNQEKEK